MKAVVAHLYIAWIHPFGDGNGRTARLLELQILLGAGFPVPTCQLLSNHYNQTRTEYYRELDLASHRRSPTEFLVYALEGLRRSASRPARCHLEAAVRGPLGAVRLPDLRRAAQRERQPQAPPRAGRVARVLERR